jgi:polar amino acid transport system substrate-binding protein
MKQVDSGNADAALETHAVLNYYIDHYFFGNLVSKPLPDDSIFSESARQQQHLGIRKDRPILKSILDKAMATVLEKEVTALRQRWYLIAQKESFNFTSEELDYLENKSKINVCVDPDWLPLDAIEDNKHTGVSGDFLKILNQKINLPFVLVKTNRWAESLEFLQDRRCDILSLAISTPQRRVYANFTQPYLQFPLVLVNRNNEPFIVDPTKIVDRKIGIVKGYAFAEVLADKYPRMQFVEVLSLRDGLEKVKRKELFGVVDLLPTATYALKKDYPSLKIAGRFDDNWNLSIAVRNDEPLLFSVFEKAIASVDKNTIQTIINDWTLVKYDIRADYTLVWQIIIIALIIGGILLYRQHLLISYNKKLEYISSIDRLTGCLNRLKIEEFLDKQINLYQRYQQNFSIILYDLDYFKKVNDEYGHLAGDKILVESSRLFQANIRQTDLLGRWGGEEFIIICPHTKLEQAQLLAESLRKLLENYHFEGIGYKTASLGVTEYINSEWSQNDLIKIADDALYQAKKKGRNCVVTSNKKYFFS